MHTHTPGLLTQCCLLCFVGDGRRVQYKFEANPSQVAAGPQTEISTGRTTRHPNEQVLTRRGTHMAVPGEQ